ncbi:MAG: GTP cyclohydrolase I FolE2 [Bdellovibrionales bacterium]|nr:GTP cyclohydrolase I FolE2 [Bdellovibrionales bacterium]
MRQIPEGFQREDLQGETSSKNEFGALDWVGMSGVQMPVRFSHQDLGVVTEMARVDAFVSLDKVDQRGIHMSRVYEKIQQAFLTDGIWSYDSLAGLASETLQTQEGASERVSLKLAFDYPILQKALVSEGRGWRSYPVELQVEGSADELQVALVSEVMYSSTCPCSAGLARELNYEAFQKRFADHDEVSIEEALGFMKSKAAMAGTPHAQRSLAKWKVAVRPGFENALSLVSELICGLESGLQTQVQTLVKREDEKEFARLNAENLMFCEDAARKAKGYFMAQSELLAFQCQVVHKESLHPHDAVAFVSQGEMPKFK